MVAGRAACPNRVQGTVHRIRRTHFDNSEHPAGADVRIYCDVGFGFRFSSSIRAVLDSRRDVARWLASKAFLRLANGLREIQKYTNSALAKNKSRAQHETVKRRFASAISSSFGTVLPG